MKLERELAMADACSMICRDNLCNTAIEHHDKIIEGFSAMRNDALSEAKMRQGKIDAIEAIKELIAAVIEMQIEVSQKLVDGNVPG